MFVGIAVHCLNGRGDGATHSQNLRKVKNHPIPRNGEIDW